MARQNRTVGIPRTDAEGRCRFRLGMAAFSAATRGMFSMGGKRGRDAESIHSQHLLREQGRFRWMGAGSGKFLFRFYQDLIRFVLASEAVLSMSSSDAIYNNNDTIGVIAFTRTAANQSSLVVGSLNDTPFVNLYVIVTYSARLPPGMARGLQQRCHRLWRSEHRQPRRRTTRKQRPGKHSHPADGFVVLAKVS